jgi:hypothetical protein
MVLAPLRNLSAAEFLVVGLATLGYKNNGSDVTKLRRFRAHFAEESCSVFANEKNLCQEK